MLKHSKCILAAHFLLLFSINVFAQSNNDFRGKGFIDHSFRSPTVYAPLYDNLEPIVFADDGKIYTTGRLLPETANESTIKISRHFANGEIDTSFNQYERSGGTTQVKAFAIQPDEKIVFAYLFVNSQGQAESGVMRVNADGSLDDTFNYDFEIDGSFKDIAVLGNGQILVGGSFATPDQTDFRQLIKLNSDGSVDKTFNGSNDNGTTDKFIVQDDGRILVRKSSGLQYIDADGNADPNTEVVQGVSDFVQQTDGKVIIFDSNFNIKRYNADLTLDSAYTAQNTIEPRVGFNVFPNNELIISQIDPSCSTSNCPTIYQILSNDGSIKRRFKSNYAYGKIFIRPNNDVYVRGYMYFEQESKGLVKLQTKTVPTHKKALDFDGDGKADIAVYRPSTGVWYILNSETGTFTILNFGSSEDKPTPGDFDGDGIGDIAVYRPSSGVWHRLNSSDGQYVPIQFGVAEDIPTQNDYDGDGIDDIAVWRPSTGVWYQLNSSNGNFGAFQFGLEGDRPVAGDYDGDGVTDYAVFRPSDGIWYKYLSINNSVDVTDIGFFETDVITPLDYDGDGKQDLFIWKDINGGWYGSQSALGSGVFAEWGISDDIPVPADYDGDDKDELATFRPSTGVHWIESRSDGGSEVFQFGAEGDIPIASAFVK